ncbi:MAG: rhodanese-like domain-containing protein [Bdellovibrionota bacterium]
MKSHTRPEPARLKKHVRQGSVVPNVADAPSGPAEPVDTWTPTSGLATNMNGTLIDRMGMHFDVCGNLAKSGRYWAPAFMMKDLVSQGAKVVLLPERFAACLIPGQTVKFAFANFDKVALLPFGYFGDLQVTVVNKTVYGSMIDLSADKKIEEEHPEINLEALYQKAASIYGPFNARAEIALLSLSAPVGQGWQPGAFGVPRASPYAKAVDKAEFAQLAHGGAALLDLRQEDYYEAETIPGAKSLNVDRTQLSVVVRSPSQLQQIPMPDPEIAKIPPGTPIVLFADNPESLTPYNFATVLALRGFDNIYYYPGGITEWRGEESATPTSVAGVSVVDAAGAKNLMQSRKVVVVDLRNVDLVSKQILPQKLVMADFTEKLDARGHSPSRVQAITPAIIHSSGDELSLEGGAIKEALPVLVFGMDEYDWKALKTAVLLHEQGKDVSWLRKGYREWAIDHMLDPKAFRFRKTKAKGKERIRKIKERHRITPDQMLERMKIRRQREEKAPKPTK